eukprot:4721694-Pyramimonas_sp.AAC.1
MKQKVLKGCKPEDTHCGTALCMCRTPGSWIGSFLTLKIAALQKHNPTRVFMGVLPGSGDISLRRFWEVSIRQMTPAVRDKFDRP